LWEIYKTKACYCLSRNETYILFPGALTLVASVSGGPVRGHLSSRLSVLKDNHSSQMGKYLLTISVVILALAVSQSSAQLSSNCTAKYLNDFISTSASTIGPKLLQAGTYAGSVGLLCSSTYRQSVSGMWVVFGNSMNNALQQIVSLSSCIPCSVSASSCQCTMADIERVASKLGNFADAILASAQDNDYKVRSGCMADMVAFFNDAKNDFSKILQSRAKSLPSCS
jgi:hypothetical protein